MYCKRCGKQLNDGASFCAACGAAVEGAKPEQQSANTTAPADDSNDIAIVGFVLSFFIAIAGLICSIIGMINANRGKKYGGFAIAGLIISIVDIVLVIIGISVLASYYSDPYYYY